ncbi:MAG: hypothetical protein LBT53_10140 [Puniceicoccales bacterium]|nr:hypothetical protein [Puniceicoccales bacterium]
MSQADPPQVLFPDVADFDGDPRFTAYATASAQCGGEPLYRSATAVSPLSEEDARRRARARAVVYAQAAAQSGDRDFRFDGYTYSDRVLTEPVLERILFDSGDTTPPRELGRLTRNRHTATILNAYRVMFVDVDTKSAATAATIGASASSAPIARFQKSPAPVSETAARDALDALVRERPDMGFRVYATRAGLRYLCTTHLFDPIAAETADLLKRLLSDPRYATLCRVQKCFRARLTPKKWRCVIAPKREGGFWARLFFKDCRPTVEPERFATCRLTDEVGEAQTILPEVRRIMEIHDKAAEVSSKKPLA